MPTSQNRVFSGDMVSEVRVRRAYDDRNDEFGFWVRVQPHAEGADPEMVKLPPQQLQFFGSRMIEEERISDEAVELGDDGQFTMELGPILEILGPGVEVTCKRYPYAVGRPAEVNDIGRLPDEQDPPPMSRQADVGK